MNAEQGFALHPLAAQDIAEIWEYIALTDPLRARQFREEIYNAIRALVPFPNQGHRRPELAAEGLRFILVREYLVAYAPDEKPLGVVAIIHGRRSPRIMAAILSGRH